MTAGRSEASSIVWLALQTPAFRNLIELVVIDPPAPKAAGFRAALPDTLIALDK